MKNENRPRGDYYKFILMALLISAFICKAYTPLQKYQVIYIACIFGTDMNKLMEVRVE